MKRQLRLSSLVMLIIVYGCKTIESNESDYVVPTSMVLTQDNRLFHVVKSHEEEVKECLNSNASLECVELVNDTSNKGTINSRSITKRAMPLFHLVNRSSNFKVIYEVGINPAGDVVMVRVQDYEGNISEEDTKKMGLNIMNVKYQSDESAKCLAIGEYSIIANMTD